MKNLTTENLKSLHFAFESELGMLTKRFMDNEPVLDQPWLIQRGLDSIKSVYNDFNIFNFWMGIVQRVSLNTNIHQTLDTIHRLKTGKHVEQKYITRLAQLGLREEYFDYIYK